MSKPIPPLDLMWLVMETQASPTHVGAMLLFEKPRGRSAVVREIVQAYRACQPTPPFNYVPEFGAMRRPVFRETDAYDPNYHVQHLVLPTGSTYEDLLRLVADLHEPMLDRSRPLFRSWLIDGVPGGRFALYTKVHHAIIDGVSGARRIYAALATSPGAAMPPPAFAAEVAPRRARPARLPADRIATLATTALKQALALREMSVSAIRKRIEMLVGNDPGGSQPFVAHRAPTNDPLHAARSFATLSLPLEEMHATAQRYGATLNDLAVTIVDEGVHRYLHETGRDFPRRLVAMCPMSLRDETDATGGTKASAMFVHLGSPGATVVDRIAQVSGALDTAKQELRDMSKEAAMMYATAILGVAELAAASGVARVTPPLANLIISNVPGGRETLYLNGARVVGTFPVSAIAASIGLNATLTSYHDRMDFGFVGNGASMVNLPALARHAQAAYEELKAAKPAKPSSRKRRPRAKTRAPRRSRS